ncbi:hypothetical protein GQ53DRAFT_747472 [Thozetella sp. PMI_491]|nr:hypothetical protein GQ53DRAFT_747472 [Thozetella sp. PMI_491]
MSALSDLSRDTGKAKMCEQGASLVEPPSMEIRDKPSTPDAEEPSSAVTNNGAAYTDGVCGSAPVIAHGSRPKAMPDGPVGDFLRRANGARIRVAASTAPTNSEPKICFAFHGDDLIATEDL